MELQIQDLISSIKKEGVDAARQEAEEIVAQAKQQAASIVAEAQKQAADAQAKAQKEINVLKESARVDAEHALRDAVLSFKKSVSDEFNRLLAADVAKIVKGAVLAKLIAAAIADEDCSKYVVEVAEITEALKGEFAAKLKGGLEIRVSPEVRQGFRVSAKDGSGYFDCSDEEIAKLLTRCFPQLSV